MRASARLGVAGGERCSGGWQPALATKPCDQADLAPRGHAADATNWLEFLGSNGVHPKLTVSNPGDREEREADAIADRVMRMTTPAGGPLPMRSVSGSSAGLSRACCASCADCEKEQEDDRPVSRKARGPGVAEGAAQAAAEAVSHDGEPLGGPERSFFEPRFGRDLSGVRIHTNSGAALAASGIDAYAYASGRHIAFAAGQYRPRTNDGLRLLAHELAHVVQQQGLEQPRLSRQVIGGGLDLEFDPCITLPDPVGEICGQSAAEACKKMPSIPGCSVVCKAFDCSKPAAPTTSCPPKWRAATSTGFAGQCCKGGIDNAKNCCPPDRISWMEDRCCPPGEVVIDNKCAKPSAVPAPPCPPGQSTLTGHCCFPPMVPRGLICTEPGPGPEPSKPPPGPLPGGPQLGVLWTDEIHFRQDHPSAGERDPASVLTPEGVEELDAVLLWLKVSSDLEVRLIGRASSEGDPPYNKELATRRTRFIAAILKTKGFSARISDPLIEDGGGSGCERLDAGQWSCGEEGSDPTAARPEDRVVRVTFARNRLPSLPQLTLPPPKLGTP